LEEKELQFSKFDEDDAQQLGCNLAKYAIANQLPITIEITPRDNQFFHATRPGTSTANNEWIKRKVRLVDRFGQSSN
jgi:uncharacterized protein (UPF0303 family)